ncbi:NUDIX domain-containing protein [Streptomyces sp. NPDC059802]|uniref:NUDIX domain-containing protein n=1 Tax=Streptomyces sp. NPDC059802 TaxID=3346952 RepID=UPI0036694D3C
MRHRAPPRHGGYLRPGGHVREEQAETPQDAAMRKALEECGYRPRLLPAPLPEGYPHPAVPDPWWTVDIAAGPDSRADGRHLHRDRVFVGVVPLTYEPQGAPALPVRWVDRDALEVLDTPTDTKVLGAHLFDVIGAVAGPRPPARRGVGVGAGGGGAGLAAPRGSGVRGHRPLCGGDSIALRFHCVHRTVSSSSCGSSSAPRRTGGGERSERSGGSRGDGPDLPGRTMLSVPFQALQGPTGTVRGAVRPYCRSLRRPTGLTRAGPGGGSAPPGPRPRGCRRLTVRGPVPALR